MHARLQPAILGGALAALLVLTGTCAAHFALIYPEADDDRPVLTADAARPRTQAKSGLGGNSSSKTKKTKLVAPPKQKLEAVTPLKRERPKSETDPPKTRRRALGW